MCRSNPRGARLFRCVGASFPQSQGRSGQEGLTREDRRRASAGGPRTFRPGRAGTATRSVRPVRVRGTPVFTQSHPGQQGVHKLPFFFISMVWKGLLPALAGNECRTNRHHNKYQHVGGRKGMVVGQNQNASHRDRQARPSASSQSFPEAAWRED